jgi:hypothetical protein
MLLLLTGNAGLLCCLCCLAVISAMLVFQAGYAGYDVLLDILVCCRSGYECYVVWLGILDMLAGWMCSPWIVGYARYATWLAILVGWLLRTLADWLVMLSRIPGCLR